MEDAMNARRTLMRRLISILLLALSLDAGATSFSTDYTDLWWVGTSENGWGINVIQQNSIVFTTMFVYGSTGQPTWFVGPDVAFAGASNGVTQFSGPLYQTNGPYFGGPFNPAAVGFRQVGQVTFAFSSVDSGTLTYSVDGTNVTKSIVRQTWANNNIAGTYVGATLGNYVGCGAQSGYVEAPGILMISQSGSNVSITAQTTDSCLYSGTYSQAGRMGSISGSLSCFNGNNGSFQATEVEAGISGLTGRGTADFGGGCTWSGSFGGIRRGP
jgi:hypothetical protein